MENYKPCCNGGSKLLLGLGLGALITYALVSPGCKAEFQRIKVQPLGTTIKEYDKKVYTVLTQTGDKIAGYTKGIETKIEKIFDGGD